MSAPDRPTQTQLNATLRVAEDGRGDAHDARLLAVEVRALRAELDEQGNELSVRRLQDLVAARTPPPAGPTPEAYAAASRALDVWHTRRHEALRLLRDWETADGLDTVQEWTEQIIGILDAPIPSAPAVPDGEDETDHAPPRAPGESLELASARRAIADMFVKVDNARDEPASREQEDYAHLAACAALHALGRQTAVVGVPDGEDDWRRDFPEGVEPALSLMRADVAAHAPGWRTMRAVLAEVERLHQGSDGEDVPARLDAALLAMCDEAEAVVEDALTATGTREVPVLDVAVVRAAVAAALARPTERQG